MMLLLNILFVSLAFSLSESIEVNTQYGPVIGQTTTVDNGKTVSTVHEFRGIPFAKDTSGDARYRNPVAPDNWVTPLEVMEPRDSCVQIPGGLAGTNPGWTRMSEDCLHLDIYTPDALSGPDTYPVMFWIHGGAYQFGANIGYPGHFLATHGVVVVVINYRLGKFGFAYTGNEACPGNAGLWDQKMALDFVIENIRNFGGDPARITVFGESAGATSTALMMMSPQTHDLFQQAILESGAENNLFALNRPESNPANFTYQLAEQLGCETDDDYDMMDCLREVPWETIIDDTQIRCSPGYICTGMMPVVDGPDGYLPKMPSELREDGNIMSGPILAGIMQDDGAMFVPIIAPGVGFDCCSKERFELIIDRLVGFFASRFDEQTSSDMYEALIWNYSQWPHVDVKERNRDALVRIVTDLVFGKDWDQQMKQHHTLADTYGFVFNYRSRNSSVDEWKGVMHSMELPYVWGFPMLQYNEHIRNSSYLADDSYNDEDVAYSYYVQELWANFAKYGNPTFEDVEKPFGGSTIWPKFNTTDHSVFYFTNTTADPMNAYRQQDYAFWTNYMNFIAYHIVDETDALQLDDRGLPSEIMVALMHSSAFQFQSGFKEDV